MAHKNLGIIQIDLPPLELTIAFFGGSTQSIDSLLSEQTKSNIIKALKGEKLIYINCPVISDSNGTEISDIKLINAHVCGDGITFIAFESETPALVPLYIFDNNGIYIGS